jgi:hypothetical protein
MNRVGRAGPICRRAFARPYKLMVIGNYSFWIAQAGISKGRKTDAVAGVVTRGLSGNGRPPVQDCRRRGHSTDA